MKFEDDFKEAIYNLPAKVKDSIILRLLKKDLNFANRLRFELLSAKSVDDKRDEVETRILSRIDQMTNYFHSPGYLMMELRYLSGEINEHLYITKDKFGEAYLNLKMLNNVLKDNNDNIEKFTYSKTYKYCIYIIARAFKILILIQSLHEDNFLDFKQDLNTLGELIGKNEFLIKTAINNGLDVNWLLSGEIPEKIKEIHKDIRRQGFLR